MLHTPLPRVMLWRIHQKHSGPGTFCFFATYTLPSRLFLPLCCRQVLAWIGRTASWKARQSTTPVSGGSCHTSHCTGWICVLSPAKLLASLPPCASACLLSLSVFFWAVVNVNTSYATNSVMRRASHTSRMVSLYGASSRCNISYQLVQPGTSHSVCYSA